MSKVKKVLIVCYTFPPMSGIGGRRWAKYAKYLKRCGWDVYVLSGTPQRNSVSPWNDDTKGIALTQVNNNYPRILNEQPTSFLQKLWYKAALVFVKTFSKGNYYDRGIFWKHIFFKHVSGIMSSNGICNLIVTGAPFSLLYYGALFKKKQPSINLISDIRDPWTKPSHFGFGSMSQKRMVVEKKRLNFVLKVSDHILAPYPFMVSEYRQQLSENTGKVHLYEHAVDTDIVIPHNPASKANRLQIVSLGTIYNGLEKEMEYLGKCLAEMHDTINLKFYSGVHKYKAIFEGHGLIDKNVFYHPIVSQQEVSEIISRCSAVLFFLTKDIKDLIATKYMEVIAARVPIIAIGQKGEASEFLEKEKLGIFIPANEIQEKMKIIDSLLHDLQYNDSYDCSKSTFDYQVHQLEELLKQ